MPSGLFYLNPLDWFISTLEVVWLFVYCDCFIEIPFQNANSVDTDQTPRSAASYKGLHCLPMPLLWDTRHKWVKNNCTGHFNSTEHWQYLKFHTMFDFILCKARTLRVPAYSSLRLHYVELQRRYCTYDGMLQLRASHHRMFSFPSQYHVAWPETSLQ